MSAHGEIDTKQLEIEDKQIELPKFYSYTGRYALYQYHNEENVRFFLCKLLDFGLRLLESPQNVTFI